MATTPKSTPIQQLPQQLSQPTQPEMPVQQNPSIPSQQPMQQPPMPPVGGGMPSQPGQPQMATPISQIPQNPQMMPKEDNNQIVNEILSEIENTHLQEAPEDTQGGNVANFQRHMDEEIHNQGLQPTGEEIRQMTEEQLESPMTSQSNEQLPNVQNKSGDDLLEMAKTPVLVFLLVFVSQLPFVNSMMTKIPKAINAQGSVTIIGSIVKALMVGIVFLALTKIL